MIHLINSNNRHLYIEELDEFHRERHRQFVIERGWPLRSVDGGEYDDYDDDQAFYLVGLSLDGGIEVGCRIRTTARGGVLPDVFSHLIADSEPSVKEPGTFECTRYFSTISARGPARLRGSVQASPRHDRACAATWAVIAFSVSSIFPS